MTDKDIIGGYGLVEQFRGKNVRVFLVGDAATLVGELTNVDGKFICVENWADKNKAVINLDHVTNIALSTSVSNKSDRPPRLLSKNE